MGATVRRGPDDQCWVHGGTTGKGKDMENSNVKGTMCEHGEDKDISRDVRKPDFCICENKATDQLCGNRTTDQRLCFPYMDSTIPLHPKSEISSL